MQKQRWWCVVTAIRYEQSDARLPTACMLSPSSHPAFRWLQRRHATAGREGHVLSRPFVHRGQDIPFTHFARFIPVGFLLTGRVGKVNMNEGLCFMKRSLGILLCRPASSPPRAARAWRATDGRNAKCWRTGMHLQIPTTHYVECGLVLYTTNYTRES